jgi:hypothetical protein
VDELIARLAGEGPPGEPGKITIDREEARVRLLAHRLAPEDQCLSELVQAAVLAGAAKVVVWNVAGGIDLAFDGRAFTRTDLEDLYGALMQATPTPETRGLRQLALGLHAALVPGSWRLRVVSGDGQSATLLELRPGQPDHLGPSDERIRGTRIELRRAGALAAIGETLSREDPREVATLRDRCRFAPIPIEVCGSWLSTGRTLAGSEGLVTLGYEGVRVTAGLLPTGEDAAVLHVVQHGVVVASEPLDAAYPAGFQAVALADHLRRDLSFTHVVRDDAFAAVLALVDRAHAACLVALADPAGARPLGPRVRQALRGALVTGRLPLTAEREALRLWDRLTPTGQHRRLSLGKLRAAAMKQGRLRALTRRAEGGAPEALAQLSRGDPCVVLADPAEAEALAAFLGVPVTRVDDALGERQGTLSPGGMLRARRILAFVALWLGGTAGAALLAHAHFGWSRPAHLAIAVGLSGPAMFGALALLFLGVAPSAFHRAPEVVRAHETLILPGSPRLAPWQRWWTRAWAVLLGACYVVAAGAVIALEVREAVSGGKPLGQTLGAGIATVVSTLLMAGVIGGALTMIFGLIDKRLIPATVLVIHARPLPEGLELRVPELIFADAYREVRPWSSLADLEVDRRVSHVGTGKFMETHVAWTIRSASGPLTTFRTGTQQLRVAGAIRDWVEHQRARMLAVAGSPLPEEGLASETPAWTTLTIAGERLIQGTSAGVWRISPTLASGQRLHARGAPWLAVRALAASRDGAVLVVASEDERLRCWRLPDPEVTTTRDVGLVHAVAASDDGAVVAWGDEAGCLWAWRAPDRPRALGDHEGPVTAVAVAGEDLLSGGVDGEVRATPLRGGPGVTRCRHAGGVRGLIAGGEIAVSGGDDGRVVAWRRADGTVLAEHRVPGRVSALARDATGTRLAVADTSGGIRVLELPGLGTVLEVLAQGPAVQSLALLDRALVVAGPDGLRRFTLPPAEAA